MVIDNTKTPDSGLSIELDLGSTPSGLVRPGSAYKKVSGVTHDGVNAVVDMREMSQIEKDFTLICKLHLLKTEKDANQRVLNKKKFGENIRDDLERGTTLGEKGIKELIQKYSRSWDNMKPFWGVPFMLDRVGKQLMSDQSPDRPGVRAGFVPEYYQLLHFIQDLHMELYPDPKDLHPHESKFLSPILPKKNSPN